MSRNIVPSQYLKIVKNFNCLVGSSGWQPNAFRFGGHLADMSHGGKLPAQETRSIDIALQGGGAYGAFTWGIFDRLLDDDRLVIDGISGTCAGAMNAAVLADGFARDDGRTGTRHAIAQRP
jgi:hypothetical protein